MTFSSRVLPVAACCAVLLAAHHCGYAADKPAPQRETTIKSGHAYVDVKVSLARSGPGLEHYATDALTVGDLVEVIDVHEGWAAIRPPVDAYSWIAASKLRSSPDGQLGGTAEVIADGAKAWIGSDVEEVSKHVSHVQLRRGEVVEVIGQKEVKTAKAKTEIWAKIRPPVGERRWVRAYELTEEAPLHAARSSAANSSERANSDDGWTDRRDRSNSLGALADSVPQERADHNPSRSSFINARDRLKKFDDEVARLQLALTRASVDGSRSGQIAQLQREIEDLLEVGKSPIERGEARRLLETAGEMQQLAAKREELGLDDSSAAADENDVQEGADQSPAARFQVKGRLMPTAYNGRPVERCAIMADEHTTLAFVTPAPGVNLRRYRWKDVGIIGEKTYPVNTKLGPVDHYVVHRVVQLDRQKDDNPWNFDNVPWIQFFPKSDRKNQ